MAARWREMRNILIPLAAAGLAACSSQPEASNQSAAAPIPTPSQTYPDINSLETANIAEPLPEPSPGATGTAKLVRYLGRWAARDELCTDGAWRFEAKSLATAGEVSCDFNDVRQVKGGYDIAASCIAEGSRSNETIRLRFQGADAMVVSSKTFKPMGLIRCEG